ncbi:unnamed protein product [Trichobilharzia szidati]|nr:unnamed protein product [Trichobilharzia szidati]
MKDIIILLNNINYTFIVFITLLINLCLTSNNNNHNNKHKKFAKKYIHNNNAYINNNNNTSNGKNEYLSISPISSEKLKQYFWKLEQLPYIDDLCQDEYQNFYASFDKFSIIGGDKEKGLLKKQLCYKKSGKICGCFSTRR